MKKLSKQHRNRPNQKLKMRESKRRGSRPMKPALPDSNDNWLSWLGMGLR